MTTTPRGPTRRSVLAAGAGAMAAGALGPFASSASAGGTPAPRDVLISIHLGGGLDALAFCPPFADPDLAAARPTVNLPAPGQPSGVIDLDGTFGLNPVAAPLMAPWNAGRLAIVQAAGTPDPTHSHFLAIRNIELGIPALPPTAASEGWLRRYLETVPAASHGAVRAIAFRKVMPLGLAGAPKVVAFNDVGGIAFPGDGTSAGDRKAALAAMYGAEPSLIGGAGLDSLNAIEMFEALDLDASPVENGAVYPEGNFGTALRQTAAAIKADAGFELFVHELGGFDHHASLGPLSGEFARRIRDLADGLAALHLDLAAHWDRVTLVAHSEFGRRVAENASGGTDHGNAGAMLVMGGAVAGGVVHGTWPGLAPEQLDDGDIAVTTDLRDVYGEVLVERLGVDLTTLGVLFPQHTYQPLGVIA